MLLSICTPSIPRRRQKLDTLREDLRGWIGDDIEWLVITDERPPGPKRNEMMAMARGKYVMHLDDDEWLSPKFPSLVLPALELGVDLVAYDALASLNGCPFFRVRTGMDFPNEQPRHLGDGRLSDIRRKPWHWNCWRTELARSVRFVEEYHGAEDAIWLEQMYPLVKTWHKIDEALFVHRYDATDSAFPSTQPAP